MVLQLAAKIFGSSNDRVLKKYEKHIAPINALEDEIAALSDDALKAKTTEFQTRYQDGESLDSMMHEAFAVVREASKRTLGMRHFDVQLVGGAALHDGLIAEMKTGEGKTLMSTLPVYLNAIPQKGVHVVTVNDYLASRDAEWMGEVYNFLDLTVGCITNDMSDQQRKAAYACDVTYATNNEIGFDYLRGNMKIDLNQMPQRPFHYAIIDEIDSILIDEARTPLIISGPSESAADLYNAADKLIPHLNDDDYELDEKHKSVVFTEDGQENVEKLLTDHGLLKEGGMYDVQNIALVHHVNQALKAHKLFKKDTDYILKDNKVVLIDEFTGRMMDGRRLSEGLHQAIEAKEGVDIQNENQTLASITFQNLFRMYPKLSGMTGTALTEAGEFAEIYGLGVVAIPTNVPIARIDHEDKIFKSLSDKNDAIVQTIKDCQERGQPVLVGTVSIEKSESLSKRLKKDKIKHNVLNARHHEQEAEIIAQAGRPGAVTIATNMAGRGTDIVLQDGVAKLGGLHVLATERMETGRVDDQLRGRAGRQGDPGSTQCFVSLEHDLLRRFFPRILLVSCASALSGKVPGMGLLIQGMTTYSQRRNERLARQRRKMLMQRDKWLSESLTFGAG